MLSPRARSIAGLLLAALLVPVVVLPLQAMPGPPGVPAASGAPIGPTAPRAAEDGLGLAVDISPGAWTMAPGDSVNLTASFTGLAEGCHLGADWFTWTLAERSFAEAFLNGSAGSAIRLTAEPGAVQPIVVSAGGNAEVDCPGSSFTSQSTGVAEIDLLPRLAAPTVTLTPNPALPGDLVAVEWTIAGGVGPYAVDVDFGDGMRTSVAQSGAGSGTVFHRFPTGEFAPQVTVSDALGARSMSADPVPLVSDSGLAVSITPAAVGPEVGRPFEENGTVAGGAGILQYAWSVNGSIVATGRSPALPSLDLTPQAPGRIVVTLAAIDAARENASAEQNLTVASPPSFALSAVAPGGDVGRPMLLDLDVRGGQGPYTVNWTSPSGGTSGSATIAVAGAQYVAIVPGTPGPVVLDATVRDAAGGVASNTFALGDVGVGPSASLVAPEGPVEAGQPLDLGLRIVGGTGPFAWSIEPSEGVAGTPQGSGTAAATGTPVNWTAVPTRSSELVVTAFVVDAVGGFAETNRSLSVLPELALALALSNASSAGDLALTVFANVGGGVPPYALEATLGGRTESLANLTTGGGYTLRFEGPPTGFDSVQVTVQDSAGINASRSATTFIDPVALLPGPSPPVETTAGTPSNGTLGTLGAGGVLVAGVAVGFWWLRRRGAPRRAPVGGTEPARALGMVRRSLATGEGLDPETLTLIGEEEGIGPAAVEAAVRQWERLGRIRREPEPSGGELVHWNPAPAPGDDPRDGGRT
ncbi:MAG TPA: hypothetical protein VMH90_03045 [Thermoplasmata archaeon]|nr:hypothetical protein [Thermoplasmata archaeon]